MSASGPPPAPNSQRASVSGLIRSVLVRARCWAGGHPCEADGAGPRVDPVVAGTRPKGTWRVRRTGGGPTPRRPGAVAAEPSQVGVGGPKAGKPLILIGPSPG